MSLANLLADLYGEPEDFLERLRHELLLHQRSIRALAREAGMDYANVKKYFANRRTPKVETMARLDEAMGRLIDPQMKHSQTSIAHEPPPGGWT